MPDINDLIGKSKNKFKKSEYRPWNYMEEMEKENLNNPIKNSYIEVEKEKTIPNISEQQNIKESDKEIEKIKKTNKSLYKDEAFLDKIFKLTGYQKILFFFLFERCISRGLLTTNTITRETLIEVLNTSLNMVKTTINRLILKGIVIREKGKNGRGGFYCFSLTEGIRNAALEYKKLTNVNQPIDTQYKLYNGSIITGSQDVNKVQTADVLPTEWESINFELLQHIGFTKDHLIQLYRLSIKNNQLDANMVQRSIYHFSYDLEHNNKAEKINRTTPIGYLMKVFKEHGPYAAPDNYESPQDKNMRIYYEKQKIIEEKNKIIEKNLLEIEFNKWQNKLSTEEKNLLLPSEIRNFSVQAPRFAYLKSYFLENIWKNEINKIVSENNDV